jgi:hypothetical protein
MNKNIVNINIWEKYNIIILEELYNILIDISKKHGLILFNSEDSFKNFIKMMYNESSKKIIDYNLFPEYNITIEDDNIYDEYLIVDN